MNGDKILRKKKATLIRGDGIGPEITDAVLKIIFASQEYCKKNNLFEDEIEFEEAVVGEKLYNQNVLSGIDKKAWDVIERNPIILKAPITTPFGGGYKSLNVTLRKTLGLFANVRPSISYHPIVRNSPEKMDLVVIRENEEDLYSGIEYRQTNGAFTALKLLTKEGSIKICHFAFEYARANGRKKVTCMIKDNIMKICDGMFYNAFLEVAKNYPEIEHDRYIIDIGAARIAARPGIFDVIVTENLYGDIISDIASEISGSVGLAGSANIGEKYSMFEAIHGSAPLMAGKQTANPSAFLNGAILMLKHMDLDIKANLIENAFLKTLEDGTHTKDIFQENLSKKKVGTDEFAEAIIERIGENSCLFKKSLNSLSEKKESKKMQCFNQNLYKDFLFEEDLKKELVGFDFFIDIKNYSADKLGSDLLEFIKKYNFESKIQLSSIMLKGLKVWPKTSSDSCSGSNHLPALGDESFLAKKDLCDFWMIRFLFSEDHQTIHQNLLLINEFHGKLILEKKFDIVKLENLYKFNSDEDEAGSYQGFSAGQGE
jgi:isocitrate dehydrogenase